MSDCTEDLGHPCDGGGRNEYDEPIGCEWCLATEAYYLAEHKACRLAPEPTREEYANDMIDAGRGHLLSDEEASHCTLARPFVRRVVEERSPREELDARNARTLARWTP